MARQSAIERKTKETDIRLFLDLDGKDTAANSISTGCGFLDHMLTLMAAHGGFRFDVSCKGDIEVDYHHTTEDIGIALGEALREALGDKKGIRRYAHIVLPMDEALTLCAVDISGRGYLNFDAKIYTEKIGDFDSELIKEFFEAFVRKSEVTLHFVQFAGENSHHIAESMFKAFGRTMAKACSIDPERAQELPSTKGVL
ncbi:MAG: imidazoleglycerol-phosphate dehydratase HisB [Clostridia bacterium]|nr:imidazoleglycerol-phosphate dehydratase HisB [Clostridia bacterium]